MYRWGMDTFSSVIKAWPSTSDLATDIGRPVGTVRQWKNRNRIPAKSWRQIVCAAETRGLNWITYDYLSRLAEDETFSGEVTQ